MALHVSLNILGWLYFIQGIPYGIQDKFIPLHMRLQNFNFSRVSLMKGLLLPWLCKGIWAPFTQVWFSPKHWLIFSISGLSVISFIASYISPNSASSIAFILFTMNVLSALQDIIVDGLAINCLHENQLGIGNSLQVVVYKIGSLFGGAGLIYFTSFTDWSTSFAFLSLLYLLSAVLVFYLPGLQSFQYKKLVCTGNKMENVGAKCNTSYEHLSGDKYYNEICTPSKTNIRHNSSNIIFNILRDVFETKDMLWLCTYVSFYKMGERGVLNNFPLFLLDKGVSPNELAFWNGIVCQTMSIFGSTVGGMILSTKEHHETVKVLLSFTVHRLLSVLMSYIIILVCSSQTDGEIFSGISFAFSILVLVYLNFTSGAISTATFTLMMEASRKLQEESRSTHYSCLASIEVAGKLIFATFAGFLIDFAGIDNSFLVFVILSSIPYVLLRCKIADLSI